MDRYISDLINICRDLNSERGPERRKAAGKLKNVLMQPSTKKALDKNHEYKQTTKNAGQIFTWESVFRAVCVYVSMETHELQHANKEVSRTTLNNRETRKQEVSGLVKHVIRLADKGSPKLKGKLLFEHVQEILKDEYTCESYGQDYCSILLKNILSVRKYMVELNTKDWHDLLFMFFKLFNDSDVKIDRLVLARIVHSLICGITSQCDVRPKKILSFFIEFFSKAKHQKSSLLLQHMMSALNVFVKAIGPNSRVQLCKLGEEILPSMLYLWHNVASDELKDEFLEFLQTQMWCHHPSGVRKDCVGAYAVDWDKWMSHLRKLYELMYSEVQQMGPTRNRTKECVLRPAFVELAVDVCQQLFREGSRIIEVTQVSSTGSEHMGPGAKKRRLQLEFGWEEIRNFINSAGQTVKMVPWLQLVTGLVSKYTASIPRNEIQPYLLCLSHTLSDCKRADLMVYIMRCIKAFVTNWDNIVSVDTDSLISQSKSTWNQVWMVTLRFVSLHSGEPEGYRLLSALIDKQLVTPRRDIWSLFVPSLTQPVTESVRFLCLYLSCRDLPEHFVPDLAVSLTASVSNEKYPLRKQLIHWLLPSRDDETEMSRSHCQLDPDWTARTLMTLTLRDPSTTLKQFLSNQEKSFLSDLEKNYLETALEMPLEVENILHRKSLGSTCTNLVHIPTVLLVIENSIKSEVQFYCSRMEEQVSDLQETVKFTRLIARLLSLLLSNQIVTSQTITTCDLHGSFCVILEKVSSSLQDVVRKDGHASLYPVVQELQGLFCCQSDNLKGTQIQEKQGSMMAAVCRAATPSKLVDILLDIVLDKHSASKQCSNTSLDTSLNQSRFNRGGSRLLDDFDDELDLEFEDQSNNNNAMEVEDLDFSEGPESQESEEAVTTDEVSQSLLSTSLLTESQLLRLKAVQTLCYFSSGVGKLPVKLKSNVDVRSVKSRIIGLLEDGVFDPSRAVDVQMMQHIIGLLIDGEQALTENNLLTMISAIRNCVKSHRRDQEVCKTCLDLLIRLVPHLFPEEDNLPSSILRECRESVLHLVNAFWKLQEESYTAGVRFQLAKFMETLVQYDPECNWSHFPPDNDMDSPTSQGEKGPTPASRLIDCAGDVCHTVRMQAVSAIYKLFVDVNSQGMPPVDRNRQKQFFSQLFMVLNDSLDIQGRLSAERLEDEKTTRISSMLTALGTVVCSSPVCEKLAVFSMIQFIKEKSVPLDTVQRVLEKVSQVLGYENHTKYMENHLAFILHKWSLLDCNVTEFPFQLLSCHNSEQFFRAYINTIMSELVSVQNMASIETVGAELGVSAKVLLKESIPYTVIHVLPVFAASKQLGQADSSGMKKKITKATTCYNLLTKHLSEEVVDKQIVNGLDEIVANLLMCLYDTDSDVGPIRDSNPEPDPPFYSTQTITWTLDYITSSFSGSGKTLVEILSKTTDSIQKILLELSARLMTCHRMSEKRRTLFMYQLFIRLLLKQFHMQLGGAWVYVLREVIVRLVHLVKDLTTYPLENGTERCYRENIACMSVELLREVCQVAVDSCPKELMKYLPLLTSNLVSAADLIGEIGKLSLSLLKFLILEKVKELQVAIATLDSFPDKAVFKECRTVHHKLKYAAGPFTLKQEVEHFLGTGRSHMVDANFRLEGLKFLYEQLKYDRTQLLSLAEDDTLCRLACELVQLTKCENKDVIKEAGKCLGVLGPISLRAISLPLTPESSGLQTALQCFKERPDVHKYCRIFHCLNTYLTDKSIELVQCTSKVLKDLLSVKTGIEFSNGYKSQQGENEYLFCYLHPFRAGKKKVTTPVTPSVNWEVFTSTVDQELLWNPQHNNHCNWLITLATTLINSGAVRDEILQLLGPVCLIKVEFCELVLPYLVHDILVCGTEDHREVLSRHVASFFSSHCGQSRSGRVSRCQSLLSANIYTNSEPSVCMNVDSVRSMLDVLQYLRQQSRPKKGRQDLTVWDNNFWLDVDYLQVAMAAQYCSAHFSSLLFAEIWCDVQREKNESNRGSQSQRSSQNSSQDTRIDTLSETSSSQSGVSVQDLLLDAYIWIGDPDGVYGCGAGRKADTSSRICTYQQENQWDKAVVSCDILMSQSETSNQYDLLHALQCFGANHVFSTYLQGIIGQEDIPNLTSDTKELQYEAAWRMGKWDIDASNKLEENTGFHECVFKAMKSIREDHCTLADKALSTARLCALSRLRDGCLTTARRLYPVMADLMCVNIVDSTTELVKRCSGSTDLGDLNTILDPDSDIEFTLPVLYMKCSAVKLLYEKTEHKDAFSLYVNSLHQLATTAREARRHQASERAIATLKDLDFADVSLRFKTQIEEAKLFWARGEENIAKPLLKDTIDKLKKLSSADRGAAVLYPQALSIYGNWLAETRSENPNIIMESYMEKAVSMYKQLGEAEDKSVDAYLALAKYADAQYQNIVNYMNSSTYEAKQTLMKKAKEEAERLQELLTNKSQDDSRYLRTLVKQTKIDKHELESMEEDRNIFLLKAVENYINCLRCSDDYNLRVFRLMSLWFNNVNSTQVNTMMEECVKEIKTYKWLPLMYQLAARMDVRPRSDASQIFLQILDKMIYETTVSHPHHTLPCVLALANADRDTELIKKAKSGRRGSKSSQVEDTVQEGRVLAAKNMIAKLREDSKVGNIVKDLQILCDAYIQLANWNVQEYKTQTTPIQLPAQLWLTKVKNLSNVPVQTREIQVSPVCDYRDIPHIKNFEPTFRLAGGINLPKIISCVGSDGTKSRQLVKGRDDLRQDAVMQQVFGMVNSLLQKDFETRKRQLQIKKYKVIPLSQRSGLLEWCEGTLPIGEYLVGSKGAHARYRPRDWHFTECRHKLTAASTAEEKYKTYQEICQKFRPVFRHFFLERFTTPPVWFERRLAYTRSVATNSIVGYILGLGDRHVQNILIDCNTAELVHIDLGIAFEQGKILPTPETVPFRLTRDIEDAMGASGVEGVFRRCCEKTMEVMRSNQEALLTILEVLLYDPLHVWTISPAKAYALQQRRGRGELNDTVDAANTTTDVIEMAESESTRNSETQENVNKVAERVLLRLRQKLQGLEDGVQLSLSGQVNYLIQEARNPKNLARIFPGWQPYV